MRKIFGHAIGLLVSLVLFVGFNVVNQFSDDSAIKYIGRSAVGFIKEHKVILYATISVLFLLQQAWLRWPKPASLAEIEDMRDAVEAFLKKAIEDYYSSWRANHTTVAPGIRVNIMLPTWRRFKCGRYLKIYYAHGGPAGIRYPDNERELKWTKENGTCGHAWAKEHTVIYDSQDHALRAPGNTLTKDQLGVVANVKSVISVPIRSKVDNSVIGVFNLDSTFNVDRTLFNQEPVVERAEAWARRFAKLLFSHGVKPH